MPTGGGAPRRISPEVRWFAVVSLMDEHWDQHDQPASYVPLPLTTAELGTRPTAAPAF